MKNNVLSKCLFLGLVLVVAVLAFAKLGQSENPPEKGDDFSGKVLVVYVQGQSTGEAFFIEKAEFRTIEGKKFLVGVELTQSNDSWADGLKHAVAWDHVTDFRIFESREDFKKRIDDGDDQAFRNRKHPGL